MQSVINKSQIKVIKTLIVSWLLGIYNFGFAQAPVACDNKDIQFSDYRNTAPANTVLSKTFVNNDLTNSVTFTNSGTYGGTYPHWFVQSNAIRTFPGGGSSEVTTMTWTDATSAYSYAVGDIQMNSESLEITGYDINGDPVYPTFSSLNAGAVLSGPHNNIVSDGDNTGGNSAQASAVYYFTSAVKSITVAQRGSQNIVIISLLGCALPADFSDAPTSFGSASATTIIGTTTTQPLKLGTVESTEASTVKNANANGDATGDDGVTSFPSIAGGASPYNLTQAYAVEIKASNTWGTAATLFAWIDWNGNGVFDEAEGLSQSIANNTSNETFTFTWPVGTTVAGTIGATGTYARFRISTDAALTLSTPSTNSVNGEIEDYRIPFTNPLPVKLISFKVTSAEHGAQLNWVTAEEINADNFTVEHSLDGKSFDQIGTVPAVNISTTTNSYQFNYQQLGDHLHYYRLKMIDLDGTFAYSRTISVSGESGSITSSLYPNPVSGHQLYLKTSQAIDNYQAYDVAGKPVAARIGSRDGDRYQITLNSNAQPGTYILNYKVQGQTFQHKFVLSN